MLAGGTSKGQPGLLRRVSPQPKAGRLGLVITTTSWPLTRRVLRSFGTGRPPCLRARSSRHFRSSFSSSSCAFITLSHLPGAYVAGPPLPIKGLDIFRPARVPELAQSLCLNLPDPLARHGKPLPHFLQGVIRFLTDTKAHAEDLLLARSKRSQNFPSLFFETRVNGCISRRNRLPITRLLVGPTPSPGPSYLSILHLLNSQQLLPGTRVGISSVPYRNW